MAKKQKLLVILEKKGDKIWGRVLVGENLIVDSANSLKELEKRLKKVLEDFEGLKYVEFEYS